MSLTVHLHPLASFCHKVLIALYENGTPFTPQVVDLGDPAQAAALKQLWPVGKFPVLRDERLGCTVAETSIIIEYLELHYPGPVPMLPSDPDQALQTRLWDRFYDLYVAEPMQKIVGDKLRPEGQRDALGVQQARAALERAYAIIEREMSAKTWAAGEAFGMADCAAAPALFYANLVAPIGDACPHTRAYHARLLARPSFARVLQEAQPYFHMFPG
ncbi:MAG TPA: glutathione S-transferase family protein [Telluria sp.]|nr:glutathione S-transferase family protein [Telluria sp.]